MELNNQNYFSPEMQMKYMGVSQFKTFMSCEARAIAELKGEYVREMSTALLIGSYIDAYFEGTLKLFKESHPEIFKRDGTLKSEYIQAEYIIERITNDELFMKYLSGEKQVIKTGEIDGVPWKIKIDSYHPCKCIVDLKVMKDFEPVYKPGEGRLSWPLAWGYDIQGAVYQAIEGDNLPFFLAGATKEKEPDIDVMYIDQPYLDTALQVIKANQKRFADLKKGIGEPIRCEHCDYCRKTKKLLKVSSLGELEDESI